MAPGAARAPAAGALPRQPRSPRALRASHAEGAEPRSWGPGASGAGPAGAGAGVSRGWCADAAPRRPQPAGTASRAARSKGSQSGLGVTRGSSRLGQANGRHAGGLTRQRWSLPPARATGARRAARGAGKGRVGGCVAGTWRAPQPAGRGGAARVEGGLRVLGRSAPGGGRGAGERRRSKISGGAARDAARRGAGRPGRGQGARLGFGRAGSTEAGHAGEARGAARAAGAGARPGPDGTCENGSTRRRQPARGERLGPAARKWALRRRTRPPMGLGAPRAAARPAGAGASSKGRNVEGHTQCGDEQKRRRGGRPVGRRQAAASAGAGAGAGRAARRPRFRRRGGAGARVGRRARAAVRPGARRPLTRLFRRTAPGGGTAAWRSAARGRPAG
jgi:hypothetical protein